MSQAEKITSAVAWNFAGKSSFFFLKFLESLLLVRLLGSEQYGLYGSLLNVESIAALLISVGLESAMSRFVPQFREEGDYAKLHALMRNIFRVRGLFAAAAVAVFLIGADVLSSTAFHGTISGFYIRLTAVLLAIVSFQTIFKAYLDLHFRLKFINLLDLATQAAYLLIAYLLVAAGYGLTAVFVTLVVVNGASLAVIARRYRRETAHEPRSDGTSGVAKKRVYMYSGTLYLLTLLNYVLGKGLDVLLIGILLNDLRQVTFYLLAFNVAFYAVSVMDIAVSGNFVVALIVEAKTQENTDALRRIFRGLFELVFLFIIPVAAGGMFLRNEIIGLLYTPANLSAAPFLVVFLSALGIGKLSSISATFLILLDREKVLTAVRAGFGVANLVLDLILIPPFGAWGAVAATGTILILDALYETYLLRRIIAPIFRPVFIVKCAAAAAVMSLCVSLLNAAWHGAPAVKVPALVVLGCAVYLGGIAVLKPVAQENVDLIGRSSLPFRTTILRLFGGTPTPA